jgi:hypothetical protein
MLNILFVCFWLVMGFFGLRFAGDRFFHEKYRSDVAAVAVVLAFAIGALWSFSNRIGTLPMTVPVATGAPAAATVCHSDKKINLTRKIMRGVNPAKSGDYGGSVDVLQSDPSGTQNATEFQAGCIIYASGWAANVAAKAPVSGVVLVVDSKDIIDATSVYREERPDVAKGYGAATMLRVGYRNAAVPTTGLAKGQHALQVGALSKDGRWYYPVGALTTITLR